MREDSVDERKDVVGDCQDITWCENGPISRDMDCCPRAIQCIAAVPHTNYYDRKQIIGLFPAIDHHEPVPRQLNPLLPTSFLSSRPLTMETEVLTPLNALETHLNSLVTSLTQTNTYANAPQIAQTLLDTDDELTSSLNLLHRHQQNYARILNLRAEAATLQEQLKSTIRQCVALRDEVGRIHPSILFGDSDGDDDSDDGDPKVAEIDYHTLLTFAARIGKHNAVAAREAEAESRRFKIASRSRENATSTTATANGVQDAPTSAENGTDETNAEIERINNTIAITRAQMGMAFPEAGGLRVGELGKLQLFRERQAQSAPGDDGAVDRAMDEEVERLVRETEDVGERSLGKGEPEGEGPDTSMGLSPEVARQATARDAPSSQSQPRPAARRASVSKPSQLAQPRRKLDLDFPSSDEEDD